MSLRSRALLMIGAVFAGVLLVLFLVLRPIVINGFIDVERRDTEEKVRQVISKLSDDLAVMGDITRDWAWWDDSYAFMGQPADAYVESNLADSTFDNNRLNLMVFLDLSGKIVLGKAYDLNSRQEMPLPGGLGTASAAR